MPTMICDGIRLSLIKTVVLQKNFQVAAVIAFVAIALRIWICKSGFFYDDGMIVLRVAENIARGDGFCYNIGEHLQAATSLLWTLIAAAVWKLFPSSSFLAIRLLGSLLDSFAAVGIALMLMFGRSSGEGRVNPPGSDPIVSALAAGLFYACASTSALAGPSGLETGLYTLLIAASFFALINSYIRAAIILSVLLVMVRPDGVLVATTFAFFVLTRNRRHLAFVSITYLTCGLAYVLGAHSYFHSILPQTVLAKQLFARSAENEWGLVIHHFFLGPAAPTGLLALLGIVEIVRRHPELRAFLLWSALYVTCFATFSQWWPWYLPPVVLVYSVCVGVGLELALRIALETLDLTRYLIPIGVALSLMLALAMTALTIQKVHPMSQAQTLRLERGQRVASVLTRASSKNDTIMLEPLGIIGFYTPRTFYDYPGLASPKTTEVLKTLHTRISKVPDDPRVMKLLLANVKPDWLVLRQAEYDADKAGNALCTCRLFATVAPRAFNGETSDPGKQCGDCNATMYLLRCSALN